MINQYRLWCETCNYVYEWSTSAPTECPNNAGHTIDEGKTAVVSTVDSVNEALRPGEGTALETFLDVNPTMYDAVSDITGPFFLMQCLVNRRELFNDQDNPLYAAGHVPLLDAVTSLNTIHGKLGWHNQQMLKGSYDRPKDLLIYYGWLNSFNNGTHGWDNEKVAQEMARYGLLAFGDGLQTLLDSGTHDGSDDASVLTDSTQDWTTDEFVGKKIVNITDGSSAAITANTATTITAALAGGAENNWDSGDVYRIANHDDYPNTVKIIDRIKALNPGALIFGYVSINQSLADFQAKVDDWDTLDVHGIFMDEAGYDYGTTTTNDRAAFNTKVDYIHGKATAKLCFANAWNTDHILGIANDASYPNTTWNPTPTESKLGINDWILLESFPVNTTAYSGSGGYEGKADWATRGSKANTLRAAYGINFAASGIINDDNANGQDLFDFLFISTLMWSLEAVGSSDTSYGSSSAATKLWTRPDVSKMGSVWTLNPSIQLDAGDADVYHRYVEGHAKMSLDFSSGVEVASIAKW